MKFLSQINWRSFIFRSQETAPAEGALRPSGFASHRECAERQRLLQAIEDARRALSVNRPRQIVKSMASARSSCHARPSLSSSRRRGSPQSRLPAIMIAGFRHRDLLASGQHMHLQSDWDRYRLETGGGAPRRNLDWTAPNFSHQPPNISFEPDASGDRCASLRKMEFICSRIGLPQGQGTRHRPQAAIQRSEPFPCP
jgi:hypothetical protein